MKTIDYFFAALIVVPANASAEVATDGTMGIAKTLKGPTYTVDADLGVQKGGNLFHSFQTFGLQSGETALFTGPSGLQNVISRVTGGTPSSINGTIRSEIVGANFWMINPAGVLFGESAAIDVPAAFHVSTADHLRFSDSALFSATHPTASTLTTAPIAAFGFLQPAPARLEINGSLLRLSQGQALSLVGGDIAITNAALYAPSGRINLISTGSAGDVLLTDVGLDMRAFTNLGTLRITHDSSVPRHVMGEMEFGEVDASGENGGALFIRAGQLFSQNSYITANTLGGTLKAGNGVDIRVDGACDLTGMGYVGSMSVNSDSGNIGLDVGSLSLRDGFNITTTAVGPSGDAGDINITAKDSVTIFGYNQTGSSAIGAFTGFGTGSGGNISIRTPLLTVDNGMSESSVGIKTFTLGAGNAGDIHLDVGRLEVLGGARIDAETSGSGKSGSIFVVADDTVLVSGKYGDRVSGIQANALLKYSGDAGKVAITTPTLVLDGGTIDTNTYSNAGSAGQLEIRTQHLEIKNDGNMSSGTYRSDRNGGNIDVIADVITLNSGDISAIAGSSSGNAGNIRLETNLLSIENGSSVLAATSGAGNGGVIDITAHDITIDTLGKTSGPTGILAFTTQESTGRAGNIYLVTDQLSLRDGSIQASTQGSGEGGDIVIQARNLDLSLGGQIGSGTWSSGRGGSIQITAEDAILLNGKGDAVSPTGIFTSAPLPATGLAGDVTVNTSRLTVTGDAMIQASSAQTSGGNIGINVEYLKLFDGAKISASVEGDATTVGGNVTINSKNVVAINGGRVIAKAKQGKGGNIIVHADLLLHNAPNISDVLNASSEVQGNDGTVQNNTPDSDLSRELGLSDYHYNDVSNSSKAACVKRRGHKRSTITKVGRGALPADNRPDITVSLAANPVSAPLTRGDFSMTPRSDDCVFSIPTDTHATVLHRNSASVASGRRKSHSNTRNPNNHRAHSQTKGSDRIYRSGRSLTVTRPHLTSAR